MKAVVLQPGKLPEVRDLRDDYDDVSNLVGGPLEFLRFGDDCALYINEDHKVRGTTVVPNPLAAALCQHFGLHPDDFVGGTMVIFGIKGADGSLDGDNHDIPDSALTKIDTFVRLNLFAFPFDPADLVRVREGL